MSRIGAIANTAALPLPALTLPSARASWKQQAPAWVALLVLAGIVLVHAVLLPSGRWQGDDYGYVAAIRDKGWEFISQRLLHWSPRPVSEGLAYIYARLVLAVHRPLLAPVLGFTWAVLTAGAIIGLCRRGPDLVWTGLIVAAVLAAFLLGHPVGEMFYWPLGALAYLPALAGVTCAALLLIRGVAGAAGRRARLGCMAALLFASFSAEVGAMVTLCVTGLIGLTELWTQRGAWRAWARESAWWAIPLAAAAGVLAMLLGGRAASSVEASPGTAAHQIGPSLLSALGGLGRVVVAPGAAPWAPLDQLAPQAAWWLAVFFAGMACAWRQSGCATPPHADPTAHASAGAPARHLLALAAGLLLAAYGSLASAAYQFGVPCCQRHDTFRACLVVLTLVVLAALVARAGDAVWRGVPAAAGPVLLLLGLLPPALDRIEPWRADARQQAAVIGIRRANWAAGDEPGRVMLLRPSPAPHVVNDGNLPVSGYFDAASGTLPWFVAGVVEFFGKTAVDIAKLP